VTALEFEMATAKAAGDAALAALHDATRAILSEEAAVIAERI